MSEQRTKRVIAGIVLAFAIVAVLAAVYAVSWGPGHAANLQSERADGATHFPIASGGSANVSAEVTPPEGWHVKPLVEVFQVPVLRELPKPPLPRDPRVMFGAHNGVTVQSPDLVLAVDLSMVAGGADHEAELAAALAESGPDSGASAGEGAAASAEPGTSAEPGADQGDIRNETLSSGYTLSYIEVRADATEGLDEGDEPPITGIFGFLYATEADAAGANSAVVRVRATIDPPHGTPDAAFTDYLPALSALLESVSEG